MSFVLIACAYGADRSVKKQLWHYPGISLYRGNVGGMMRGTLNLKSERNTDMRIAASPVAVLAALFVLMPPSLAFGQFEVGGNFTVAIPKGEFNEKVENNGFGFTGQALFSVPGSPVAIGGSFGGVIYGRETREEPFSMTIPDVTVDVETNNYILLGHIVLRIQAPAGPFRPYADGVIGFHYLFTQTSIKSREEDIASDTNFDDGVLSYGGGGGIMFLVYDGGSAKPVSVYVDLGARYLKGGKAQYLKEGSIRREGGRVLYDVEESRTDLLAIYIGASAKF
jgi:hypothetical protein